MMFTGLIETVGKIEEITVRANYKLLKIRPVNAMENITSGESIAVDGCCLTVTEYDKDTFTVEASQETVGLTIVKKYSKGHPVNLERALLPTSRLGGHFVAGHVDCLGKIQSLNQIGDSWELSAKFPEEFAPLVVSKGSIAINGISLTINKVAPSLLTVNIIPHTFEMTNLKQAGTGDAVNLEFDIIGKYVVEMLKNKSNQGITWDKLIESGW
jgi:riboflavin synthase